MSESVKEKVFPFGESDFLVEESKEQMQEHKKTILRECESLAALLKRYQELEERKQHLSRFLSINAILTQSEAILRDVRTSILLHS